MRFLSANSLLLMTVGVVFLAKAATTVQAAAPIVSNITAVQRETGGRELDITYDLNDPDGDLCTITIEIFDPDGRTIRPQFLSGDYGAGVTSGTGKLIVWDVMREIPGRYATNWRARIIADDGQGEDEILYALPGTTESVVLVRIPAGEFTMGSPDVSDAQPVHTVYLDEYWIMKYPITVAQWRAYRNATGGSMPDDPGWSAYPNYMTNPVYDNYPIVNVSWDDVLAFANWADLSLPTEAQWEKAARGTDARTYPWGNEPPCENGVCRANGSGAEDGYEFTSPVGAYGTGTSPYGVFDMAGNVWEWCADKYDANYYSQTPPGGWVNPTGPSSGFGRIYRGGDWNYGGSSLRSAVRNYVSQSYRITYIGARLARNP